VSAEPSVISSNRSLVAVGEVMLDVESDRLVPGAVLHSTIRVRAGGSPVTAALWAAVEGVESAVVGRIGADPAGRAVRETLLAAGVQPLLAVDGTLPTGTFLQAGSGEDTAIVADRGANSALGKRDVPAVTAGAVLVSGYALLHETSTAAARAALDRATAQWVAVDAGSARLVASLGAATTLRRMVGANTILANEDEARALTGEAGDKAVRALTRRFRLVCVKRGADGSTAALDGTLERAAPPERLAAGKAGAGDAFAGVLLASLLRGRSLGEALERACAAGARAAAGVPPKTRDRFSPGAAGINRP
jgi:sugar/nucleoside kinase (ribokinase family)